MNVLLVVPAAVGGLPSGYQGMAYISACLKESGHTVSCIHGASVTDYEKLLRDFSRKSGAIDIVGTGGMSVHLRSIKKLIAAARSVFPDAVVLLGGNIVTCMPKLMMRELDADFGIMGEGELSTVHLLQTLSEGGDPRTIPGVVFKDPRSGEIHISDKMDIPQDLDAIPFPDMEAFGYCPTSNSRPTESGMGSSLRDDERGYGILCTRSCPYNCSFCYHPPGHKFRQRSLENILAEIDMAIDRYDINHVNLGGEVIFTKSNPEFGYALCNALKKRKLTWNNQLMINAVTDDLLRAMKDSGCVMISYGIESVSDKILKSMRKGTTRAQIEDVLEMTYSHSIDIQGNILFGDREETWETFNDSVSWWLKNPKYMLELIQIYVCPNSDLYLDAVKRGIIKNELEFLDTDDPRDWIVNVTKMSDAEYKEMARRIHELRTLCGYFPGVLKRFYCRETNENGRKMYHVETVCPHCSGSNRYERLSLGANFGVLSSDERTVYQTFDRPMILKCRNCTRRYHIPNLHLIDALPKTPRRMFGTHVPSHKLLELYFKRGGNINELTDALY